MVARQITAPPKRPRESPKKPTDQAHEEAASVAEGPVHKQLRMDKAHSVLPHEEKNTESTAQTGPSSNDM